MSAQIGHNGGPSIGSTKWQSHCWRQARAALLPNLPIEVVRTRVKRAKALGLDYKTYAGVRATTGRDLVAFLFSSNALNIFRDGADLDAARVDKLVLIAADKHLAVSPGVSADMLGQRITASSTQQLPPFGSKWGDMRIHAKAWLNNQGLPGDAVLMIGETDHEREFMTSGNFAGFISGTRYFTGNLYAL